jgi:hypothetical protein
MQFVLTASDGGERIVRKIRVCSSLLAPRRTQCAESGEARFERSSERWRLPGSAQRLTKGRMVATRFERVTRVRPSGNRRVEASRDGR